MSTMASQSTDVWRTSWSQWAATVPGSSTRPERMVSPGDPLSIWGSHGIRKIVPAWLIALQFKTVNIKLTKFELKIGIIPPFWRLYFVTTKQITLPSYSQLGMLCVVWTEESSREAQSQSSYLRQSLPTAIGSLGSKKGELVCDTWGRGVMCIYRC